MKKARRLVRGCRYYAATCLPGLQRRIVRLHRNDLHIDGESVPFCGVVFAWFDDSGRARCRSWRSV
jgi:hypothetical protein